MKMDKDTLIRIAEELHQGAFDANAYYLILQQYRKNQLEYAEEMKLSPAFYQTIHGALMKACFMEIAKLYDSSNGVVSIGTLLTKCAENQDLFPTYRTPNSLSCNSCNPCTAPCWMEACVLLPVWETPVFSG